MSAVVSPISSWQRSGRQRCTWEFSSSNVHPRDRGSSRGPPRDRRAVDAARGLALAPVALIALLLTWNRWRVDTTSRRRAAWIAVATVAASSAPLALLYAYQFSLSIPDVRQAVSYLWQFYPPRAPFMTSDITHGWEVRNVVVDRFFSGFANYEVSFTPEVLHALARGPPRSWRPSRSASSCSAKLSPGTRAPPSSSFCPEWSGPFGSTPLPYACSRWEVLTRCSPAATCCRLWRFTDSRSPLAVSWVPGRVGAAVGGALLAIVAAVQVGAFAILVERFYG